MSTDKSFIKAVDSSHGYSNEAERNQDIYDDLVLKKNPTSLGLYENISTHAHNMDHVACFQ